MKRLLGIDYGDAKVGLALGDDESRLATPFLVIKNEGDLIDELRQIVTDEDIQELVVGVPYPIPDSTQSAEQMAKTKLFIERLSSSFVMPIHEVDERFSTKLAMQSIQESGGREMEDAIAAMYILQTHLDMLENFK